MPLSLQETPVWILEELYPRTTETFDLLKIRRYITVISYTKQGTLISSVLCREEHRLWAPSCSHAQEYMNHTVPTESIPRHFEHKQSSPQLANFSSICKYRILARTPEHQNVALDFMLRNATTSSK